MQLFTARQRSCRKVMFSVMSICLSICLSVSTGWVPMCPLPMMPVVTSPYSDPHPLCPHHTGFTVSPLNIPWAPHSLDRHVQSLWSPDCWQAHAWHSTEMPSLYLRWMWKFILFVLCIQCIPLSWNQSQKIVCTRTSRKHRHIVSKYYRN